MPTRAFVWIYSFDAASDSTSVTVPAGCEVLEIAVATISSGQDQTGVTVGGQACTKIGTSIVHSGGKPRLNVWRRISPPTGSQTIVVTNASGDKTGVGVCSWTNIDTATPFDGWATAQGTSATPSRTVTSETGDRVADAAASLSTGQFTPGGGQTELYDFTPVDGHIIASHEAGDASVTMSWTGTESKEWVIAGWNANDPIGETAPQGGGPATGRTPAPGTSLSVGGATAAGTAPSEGGGPVEETPVPGGALAAGLGGTARVLSAQNGAVAAGSVPSSRSATPTGGGLAAGVGATAKALTTQGGAVAAGVAPSDGSAAGETPTPGGGIAAGNGLTGRTVSSTGGSLAAANAPMPSQAVVISGASASGQTITLVLVPLTIMGATAGGPDPTGGYLGETVRAVLSVADLPGSTVAATDTTSASVSVVDRIP